MSGRRRTGASEVAKLSWGGGQPERLGRKRKKDDTDEESDEEDRGYYTSSSGTSSGNKYSFGKQVSVKSSNVSDGDVGAIEKVHLENFMCHDSLTWDPNRRINFVTGQNGAGKSSVLQGLVLGLLGETKHIKRFSKVSEFIKKGTNKCVIQVTLSNRGDDAYKPELYGSSITFQRTITDTGSSAYLLKDENLKDVVRKSKDAKEECKRILDKFQIQLDSPIVILHQDEAKEMLKMESPDKLYKFFEKSTLIKQCFEQYSAAQVEYQKAFDTLKEKARSLRDLNHEYKKAQAKYAEIQRSEQMDKDLHEAKGEYAWARVLAAQENVESLTIQIEKVQKKIEQPKSKLMNLHEKLASLKMQKTELEIQIEDESSTYINQEQELLGLQEEIGRLKQDLKQLNATVRQETQHKNTLTQEVRVLKEQLDAVTKRNSEEFSRREKNKLERKLVTKKLEQDKKEIQDQIEQEGRARESVDAKLREDQEKERAIRRELDLKKDRERVLRQELRELESAGKSEQHLAVFGAKVPLLEAAIRSNKQRFRQVPIGPVGAHVKLTGEAASSPEVARLVETELTRAQITSYLCDNDEDRRQLSRLCDEVYGGDRQKPRIFTSRFIHHKHKVVKPVVTNRDCIVFLNLLHIENPIVFNHLVDQRSIESVLVCKTQDVAKSLTTRKENVPANVSYAITYDSYRFYPPKEQSSYRSYYMNPLQGTVMLKSTMTNLLKERGMEMEGLSSHIKDLNSELSEVGRSIKSYEAEKKRSASEIKRLQGQMAHANSQLSQVKAEEDNLEDDADNIRARITTRNTELEAVEEKIEEALSSKELLNDLIKEKDEQFKMEKRELNALKSVTNPLLKQQRETETMISNRTKEIMNQEKLVKKMNSEIDVFKREMKASEIEAEQFKATALTLTDGEIVPERSVKQLDVKIKKLKEKIKNKHKDLNLEAFYDEFNDLKERHTTMKKQIQKLETLLNSIEKMNAERLDNFICIRNLITNNVRRRFNLMIKEFSKQIGSEVFLRIDNASKELKFNFNSGGGSEGYSSSDVSLLSGGEKSYTQMCLICALWDMMRPPFRCLDEWDVFLDAVNRKTISEELLRFCLRNPDKQFIFISPQVTLQITIGNSRLLYFNVFPFQGACDLKNMDYSAVTVTEIKKS